MYLYINVATDQYKLRLVHSLGLFGKAPAPPKTAPAPASLVERLLWWSWSRFENRLAKQLHPDFHEWIEMVNDQYALKYLSC